MSKLEELTPPLNLCKLIPKGEFEDSYFVWKVGKPLYNGGKVYIDIGTRSCPLTDIQQIPAPTLQEILTVFPDWSELSVDFVNPQITLKLKKGIIKAAPAEVLKLWLKVKGIDYEK